MNFNQHLDRVLDELLSKVPTDINNDQLLHCIDLTLLDYNSSKTSLLALNELANTYQVAAVCVFPHELQHLKLENSIKLATVVNFPHGIDDIASCIAQIEQAMCYGVNEIDYVVPYSLYLEGKKDKALHQTQQIIQYCKQHQLVSKIILETGAFLDLSTLYQLASELIEMEVDFLKTSTGKTTQGASLSAVFTLLSAIKDSKKNIGIKISGGVKTASQARNYAYLSQLLLARPINNSWFRLGASSLVEELIKN